MSNYFEDVGVSTCTTCGSRRRTLYVDGLQEAFKGASQGADVYLCGDCTIEYLSQIASVKGGDRECDSCSDLASLCEDCARVECNSCSDNAEYCSDHATAHCDDCGDLADRSFCIDDLEEYVAKNPTVREIEGVISLPGNAEKEDQSVKYEGGTAFISLT